MRCSYTYVYKGSSDFESGPDFSNMVLVHIRASKVLKLTDGTAFSKFVGIKSHIAG